MSIVNDFVEQIIESVIDAIKNEELESSDDLDRFVTETINPKLTYTADCFDIIKGWNGDLDCLDRGLWEGAESVYSIIASLAYAVLDHDVRENLETALEDVFGTAEIENIEECEYCSDHFNSSDVTDRLGGSEDVNICLDCFDQHFKECDACELFFPIEEMEGNYCKDCDLLV